MFGDNSSKRKDIRVEYTFKTLPLNTPALFKHSNSSWSSLFEIIKLKYSKNGKACFLSNGVSSPVWYDVEEAETKWTYFDDVGENHD